MMKCPYCNKDVEENIEYCSYCGHNLYKVNSHDEKDHFDRIVENDKSHRREIENFQQELESKHKKNIIFFSLVVCMFAFLALFFIKIRPAMIYSKGEKYIEEHKYIEAEKQFNKLPSYNVEGKKRADEARYLQAEVLYEEGKYQEALEKIDEITFYHNDEVKPKCIQALLKEACVGEEIQFGLYEQDTENSGDENIDWIILDKQEDKVLLISKHVLECKAYNEEKIDISWENCTLREWLNNDFINDVFTDDEREIINISDVSAEVNSHAEYDRYAGNPTQDRVFLLSINEALYYFGDDDLSRCALPTKHVSEQFGRKGNDARCDWWLRTPGSVFHDTAANIHYMGGINYGGTNVDEDGSFERVGVRPALWINLE